MFSSLFSVFATLLSALSLPVFAAPTSPTKLLAFAPTIVYPTNESVWIAGGTYNVSWKTDNVPPEARNYTLIVYLGHLANNSENLNTSNPLATEVPIMSGSVAVTIPASTPPSNNSIIDLLGDSGDISQCFNIISALSTSH